MIRDNLAKNLDSDPHFRWRGESVTRIENLSDIVFALALGMLVSGGTVPTDVATLNDHLLNIVPVAAGFAILVGIWHRHYMFFRRYGVETAAVLVVNAALLLVVLFMAYPLRLIFDSFFDYILFVMGFEDRIRASGATFEQSGLVMGYFAGAYAVAFGLLSLMFSKALKMKEKLELNAGEINLTKQTIWMLRMEVIVSVTIGLIAVLTPLNAFAGTFFCLLWPLSYLIAKKFPAI